MQTQTATSAGCVLTAHTHIILMDSNSAYHAEGGLRSFMHAFSALKLQCVSFAINCIRIQAVRGGTPSRSKMQT